MICFLQGRLLLASLMLGTVILGAAPAPALSRPARVERIVLLYRHGLRAPLPDEAGLAGLAGPMPRWPTEPGILTPHGARALTLLTRYQRGQWQAQGLLPARGCPSPRDLAIWTNTAQRTIASGEALAEGLAPGCALPVGHLPAGQHDAIFEPLEAGAVTVDGMRAAQDVNAYTGGARAMALRYAPQLATMAHILGCERARPACDLARMPGAITASPDNHGLSLSGPIDTASGTAQVLLLEYMEGMPLRSVGWGRAGPQAIARVSPLHAALFDVFDRSPYMAPRSAGPLARRMLSALFDADQPRITLLVGHDNNIAALASLLHTRFRVPGLGWNDPPPGGALGLALVRKADGRREVRAFYLAATPGQVRRLTRLDTRHRPAELSLPLGLCGARACPAARFRQAVLAALPAS